tara:strand:+ start:1127 stop:1378 length:252 start_codon:yes stop_codon:yes gene_type:complete
MTDLERFVLLYASFGIICKVEKEVNHCITFVEPNPNQDEQIETISDRFQSDTIRIEGMGNLSASSQIWFDEHGKFMHQEFLIP